MSFVSYENNTLSFSLPTKFLRDWIVNNYSDKIKTESKKYLDNDLEIVELQDLQAVTGLKAIRVSFLYHKDENDKAFYTYDDLMKEIKA